MNKQEAIDELKKYKVGFGEAAAVRFDRIVSVINQIHEPQKVVVPKHIADKIEYCKDAEGYGLFHTMDYCYQYKDSAEWLECNQETFARAWLDGYEIEQKQLYTVEIPDPNVDEYSIVLGRKEGRVQIKQCLSTIWQTNCNNQLTEAEIKEDFEWAWQFAKEVE
ncbi:DUF1642 domain-containing protein [Streptococcus suis]|uniref:DUF1642 domain-containing protein n=1 Tax=Streptococcus suis TaxID=1307 RepID=UPI0037D0C7BB